MSEDQVTKNYLELCAVHEKLKRDHEALLKEIAEQKKLDKSAIAVKMTLQKSTVELIKKHQKSLEGINLADTVGKLVAVADCVINEMVQGATVKSIYPDDITVVLKIPSLTSK